MTTRARQERRGTAKRWFSSSQAARYLGVSVDTIRDLDESGELQAERTKGGHRRFSREKLDAYLRETKRGRNVRPEVGARRPPPRASRAQRIPEPPDDDPEDLELMDAEVEAAVEVPPPVRVPQPNPLERLVRDMTEQLKRDRAEAPRRRLVALKQYGLNQVPWGVPDSWRPKVATALEGYVTLENFPSWVSDQQAYAFVRGKVEEVLQPYRDEVARGQQETQDQRRVQALIDYGKRYASDKAPFDWESEDRDRALRDVERMLKDSVEPDWTEQRVKDAVDDQLDEREEEPDDDDEDDEDEDEDDENDENEEETDEF